MKWRLCRVVLLCAMVRLQTSSAAGADGPEAPATEAELRQMLKDGQYQALALKATRALQLKGEAAKGYDRAQVLMLKGEAQLRLKQTSPAIDAFAAAAKEAKDPKDAALATATELLVRKSAGGKYSIRPRGGGKPEMIDILDDAGRKQALAALYADEAAAAAPKLKAAESAKALPAITDALKLVMRLGALERVATGTDERTAASVKDLGVHAQALMTEAVQAIAKDVQQIGVRANTVRKEKDSSGAYISVKQGLSPVDTRALRADVANGEKIAEAAQELAAVTKVTALGGVASEASRVVAEAQNLLDTQWSTPRGTSKK